MKKFLTILVLIVISLSCKFDYSKECSAKCKENGFVSGSSNSLMSGNIIMCNCFTREAIIHRYFNIIDLKKMKKRE